MSELGRKFDIPAQELSEATTEIRAEAGSEADRESAKSTIEDTREELDGLLDGLEDAVEDADKIVILEKVDAVRERLLKLERKLQITKREEEIAILRREREDTYELLKMEKEPSEQERLKTSMQRLWETITAHKSELETMQMEHYMDESGATMRAELEDSEQKIAESHESALRSSAAAVQYLEDVQRRDLLIEEWKNAKSSLHESELLNEGNILMINEVRALPKDELEKYEEIVSRGAYLLKTRLKDLQTAEEENHQVFPLLRKEIEELRLLVRLVKDEESRFDSLKDISAEREVMDTYIKACEYLIIDLRAAVELLKFDNQSSVHTFLNNLTETSIANTPPGLLDQLLHNDALIQELTSSSDPKAHILAKNITQKIESIRELQESQNETLIQPFGEHSIVIERTGMREGGKMELKIERHDGQIIDLAQFGVEGVEFRSGSHMYPMADVLNGAVILPPETYESADFEKWLFIVLHELGHTKQGDAIASSGISMDEIINSNDINAKKMHAWMERNAWAEALMSIRKIRREYDVDILAAFESEESAIESMHGCLDSYQEDVDRALGDEVRGLFVRGHKKKTSQTGAL